MNGPKTMSVPEAGKLYYDLSRNRSYEAARRGFIPVIKIGKKLRVPVAAMERQMEEVLRAPQRGTMLDAG